MAYKSYSKAFIQMLQNIPKQKLNFNNNNNNNNKNNKKLE